MINFDGDDEKGAAMHHDYGVMVHGEPGQEPLSEDELRSSDR